MNIEKDEPGQETQPLVVGIGELLWDELPDGKQLGGAPANYAYHCNVLGARAYIVSAVGDDEAGRELTSALESRGLSTEFLSRNADHPTGRVSISLLGGGVPEYTIHENAAWDFIPCNSDILELAARAKAICFGSLAQRSERSRESIRSVVGHSRADSFRLFDINLRQEFFNREMIGESLDLANALKLNDDELSVISDLFGVQGGRNERLAKLASNFELNLIALTMDERGCVLYRDGEFAQHGGFPLNQIVDTVGAGDCFSAVVTMGVLRGDRNGEIAEQANRSAAYVCTQAGAMPEMPLS